MNNGNRKVIGTLGCSWAAAALARRGQARSGWRIAVQLDGVPVRTTLGGGGSIGMNLSTAKRLFGLTPDNNGMIVSKRDGKGSPREYRYSFKSLTLEALTIRNPEVYIQPDSAPFPCDSSIHFTDLKRDSNSYSRCTAPDMWMGFHELKKLHLYFAFGEKKLYLTAADAHR